MDVIIKTEPPDDEYMQATSVPEDSQWQKKRSKLHNLLFGNHDNTSPRVRTPEPQVQTEPEGFAVVRHENGPESETCHPVEMDSNVVKRTVGTWQENMMDEPVIDHDIVVKVENVEEDEYCSSNRGDFIPVKDPYPHRNGSPQLTNPGSESCSLLKSMLTCPISNIESPSLSSLKSSLNEKSTGKYEKSSAIRQMHTAQQEKSSEIRKMLAEPPRTGTLTSKSALSSAVSSSTSVTKSNPVLSDSLFSASNKPMATTSASALLQQLSFRSRQTSKGNTPSPSFPRPKISEQSELEIVCRKESPAALEKAKKPHEADKETQEIADSVVNGSDSTQQSVEDDEIKTKAIEEAVGNFSQFLQSTMSKHDFNPEQMKFIMASAMQSASKVISEAAKKSNATESMKETAASFIENAIGKAIRSETSKKLATKTAETSDRLLKNLILEEWDGAKNGREHDQNSKQNSGKEFSKWTKKRKRESQSETKGHAKNSETAKKKKRMVEENLEHSRVEMGFPNDNKETENQTTCIPVVTVKEEPIEYSEYYSENMKFLDGRIAQTEQTGVTETSNSRNADNAITENPRMPGPRKIVEDSGIRNTDSEVNLIKKEPEEELGNCSKSDLDIAKSDEKAKFSETGTKQMGSVIDLLKEQITKNFKEPLGVEMKYKCPFCPITFPNTSFRMKHIHKKHSKENTGLENDETDHLKTVLEQARNAKRELVAMNLAFKCKICGLEFEHKGSLRVHERGHNSNNDNPYQCNLCGKCVTDESYLKLHMYTHRDSDFLKGQVLIFNNETGVPKDRMHLNDNETGVPKQGMCTQDTETVDTREMERNERPDVTVGELDSHKTIKLEAVNEHYEEKTTDKYKYLWTNDDNGKGVSQCIVAEIAAGVGEDDRVDDDSENYTDSDRKRDGASLRNPSPDMSLVKVEPESVDENRSVDEYRASHENESADKNSVGNHPKKNLSVTNFLDKEIEKNLKQTRGIVHIFKEISYKDTKEKPRGRKEKPSQKLDDAGKADTPSVHKCDTCGLEFEHKGTLKVHQRGHNAKKSCQCPICGKSVTDTSYLKIHMRTHETEIDFENRDQENWEASEKHNKNSLRCETCKLQFSSYGHYEMHQRMHNGEKVFQCSECEMGFASKNLLQAHQGIHTGLKPYKCSKCDMSFRQNSGLRLHLLVHEEEKPKKCPFCDASFSRKAHLDKHIRYHSGERPFVCEICSKSFVDKELLKQHAKKVHVDGKPGKRGAYKERLFPVGMQEQLGPNWKGFQTVYDPSDKMEIPKSSYPCGVCGETYNEIPLLVEHLETHNKPEEEENEFDMVSDDQFSNTMAPNNNLGSMFTDYTIRGLLNSSIGANTSPGMSSSASLGLGGLDIEKLFKCPFCEESFDLPGPRIRHIHEVHPFNKNSPVVLDPNDPDYLLKQHLLEERTTVETLYGTTAISLASNTPDIKPPIALPVSTPNTNVKPNVKSISDLLNSNSKPNTKSTSNSNVNSNFNVKSTPKSNVNFNSDLPKPEPVDYSVVKIETTEKSSNLNTPQNKDLIKLPCPYCDRIYQRQSSRTRHINENHRDKKEAYKLIKEIRDRQGPFMVE